MRSLDLIRNFSIIAHVDHGKSTLADHLLLKTGAIKPREFRDQILDDMDLERERGITIKARAVRLLHAHHNNEYKLHLIDTPGHVDFSYEVSRSLTACEGALLVVDAAQGVEAQTVANVYLCLEQNLELVPVITKIDLPQARPEEVAEEIEHSFDLPASSCIFTSSKSGEGVDELLQAIIDRIPPPGGRSDRPLKALVFDSVFDDYRGVISYIRVFQGEVHPGDRIRMLATKSDYQVDELGVFSPRMTKVDKLSTGEVGYLIASIKTIRNVKIGDTITTLKGAGHVKPLPGYRDPLPMVFCGLFPAGETDISDLRTALEKLRLNDSAFNFEPEASEALGLGFRCGFLGLLHMEIVQERLEREFQMEVVQTAPNVTYEILLVDGKVIKVENPASLPDPTKIEELREPIIRANIVIPSAAIGAVMKLCEERRGTYKHTEYLSQKRVILAYELPLADIIYDFYDKLKSSTRGYGTLDYEHIGFRASDLIKLDILIAGKKVDALSSIIHRSIADLKGRTLARRLRKVIDRHLFEIPIQAAIGSRIIARENIKALRKNVTAKCYGGDISRKKKLLKKQQEGKKRMKQVGQVSISQEAFLTLLRGEDLKE